MVISVQPHLHPCTWIWIKKGRLVLKCHRKGEAGMCHMNLTTTPQSTPTPTFQLSNNLMAYWIKPEISQWYHTTLFISVNKTLIQAIKKGYFDTWHNLEIYIVNKHLPPSVVIVKGQKHQTRKKLNSTMEQDPKIQEESSRKPMEQHTNTVFSNIIYPKRPISTDLTGELPVTSNRGNKYLLVL